MSIVFRLLWDETSGINREVDNYSKLSSYRATVDRLYNFRASCLSYLKPTKGAEDTSKMTPVHSLRGDSEQFAWIGSASVITSEEVPILLFSTRRT